jgi:uncharacterized membrane protein
MAERALPAAAVLWALLIVAAPWSGAAPGWLGIPRLAGAATYVTGSLVCHQRPDRSFHSHGAQWPVCARCSGLYLSAAIGVVFVWLRPRAARAVPFHTWQRILVAAAVPTGVTLALEWWVPSWSSGLVRAVAAVPLGAAVGVLLAASMSFRGRLRGCERTR